MQRVQPTNQVNKFFAKECLDVSQIETHNWSSVNTNIVASDKTSTNPKILEAVSEFRTKYKTQHEANPAAREELLKITKEAAGKIQKALEQQSEAVNFIKCIEPNCIKQNWANTYNSIYELKNSDNPELKNKANEFLEKYKAAYNNNSKDEATLLSITTEHLDSLKKIINPEYCPRLVLPAVSAEVVQSQNRREPLNDLEKQYGEIKRRLESVRVPANQQYRIDGLDGLMAYFKASEARENTRALFPEYDAQLLARVPSSLKSVNSLVEILEVEKQYADVENAKIAAEKARAAVVQASVDKLTAEPYNFTVPEVNSLLFYNDTKGQMPALDPDTGKLKYDSEHLHQIKNYLEILKKPQDLTQDELNGLIAQMRNDPFFTENKAANSTEKNLLNTLISRAEDAIIGKGITDLAVPSAKTDGLSFKITSKDNTRVYQAVIDSNKWENKSGPDGDIYILDKDKDIMNEFLGIPGERLKVKLEENGNKMIIQLTKKQEDGSFKELDPLIFERKQ